MSFNQIIILSAVFEARNQRTYCAFVACEVSCHEQALSHALQEEYILIRPGHAKPVCGVLSYRAFSAFSVLRRARKWHTYATFGLWTIPIGSSLSKTQKHKHAFRFALDMQNDSAESSLIVSSAPSQKWPRRLDETHAFEKVSPSLEQEMIFSDWIRLS